MWLVHWIHDVSKTLLYSFMQQDLWQPKIEIADIVCCFCFCWCCRSHYFRWPLWRHCEYCESNGNQFAGQPYPLFRTFIQAPERTGTKDQIEEAWKDQCERQGRNECVLGRQSQQSSSQRPLKGVLAKTRGISRKESWLWGGSHRVWCGGRFERCCERLAFIRWEGVAFYVSVFIIYITYSNQNDLHSKCMSGAGPGFS